jgi:hypothetical protein
MVVTAIFPVIAPVGTVAVTWISELTVKVVAATPPKVTPVVWVNPVPVMVTMVPTWPEDGEKLPMVGVTLNVLELVADPPDVVTVIFPVLAPLGTVALTLLSELTVKVVALTPPKVTFVVCVRPVPLIVTTVPIGPLVGEMLLIVGVTLNCRMLFRLPLGRVTVTVPVLAPVGTIAVKYVSDETVKVVALTPLKETAVVPVKP